jgi:hypothetical protein
MGVTKPTRVVLRETWVLMKEKSRSYAKGFAGMGFLYSGTECMIERYRAKHDSMNATLAGCATGGLMAAPGAAEVAVRYAVGPRLCVILLKLTALCVSAELHTPRLSSAERGQP